MPGVKKEEKKESKLDVKFGSLKTELDADLFLLKQQEQFQAIISASASNLKKTKLTEYPKVRALETTERLKKESIPGHVRASPYGACLQGPSSTSSNSIDMNRRTKEWTEWRNNNLKPLNFPVEGFDHMYGKKEIDENQDYGAKAAAMAVHGVVEDSEMDESGEASAREYGSFRTPLDAPIGSLKDKWRVLPHFLQVRSLMRQHIDSFDYFVNTEMKEIVQSPSACEIRSEHDPKFYLRYTDCWVGEPSVEEDSYATTQATPFQCRLRDCTYSAPIYVNIRYTRGRQIVVKKKVSTEHLHNLQYHRRHFVCLFFHNVKIR
jgi:hypothetical protein